MDDGSHLIAMRLKSLEVVMGKGKSRSEESTLLSVPLELSGSWELKVYVGSLGPVPAQWFLCVQ